MKVFPKNKALVLPAKDVIKSGLRPQHFSKSKLSKATGEVVVPLDIPTVSMLYSAGITAPSPIRFEYAFKWARDLPPFKHQVATADFVTKIPRGFIFNDIGTGKTLSALWAADYLIEKGLANKILIATTVSTMNLVWSDALFTSFNHRTYQILSGTKQARLKKLAKDADFYIINHDGLKVLCEWERSRLTDKKEILSCALDERPDIDMIIVDECAVVRNKNTDIFNALDRVTKPTTNRKLWLMSGDPMPNKPTDIWAQARLVNPTILPKYFTRFKQQTMIKISDYKWVAKKGWESYIYERLGPYCIRFTRDECLDLPERTYSKRSCEMSKDQQTAYNTMAQECKVLIANKRITAANEGVKINKLLQIACGTVFDRDGETHYLDISAKLKMVEEALEHSHNKLILFAPFVPTVKMLQQHLTKKKITVGTVYGAVSKSKRDTIFRDFKEGKLQVLLAQPKTMAHGLDFTNAHTVCWWSPVDDYDIFNQANGRITRPGQTVHQTIIELVCSPIEQKIYSRLENKEKMQGLLMSLFTETTE